MNTPEQQAVVDRIKARPEPRGMQAARYKLRTGTSLAHAARVYGITPHAVERAHAKLLAEVSR